MTSAITNPYDWNADKGNCSFDFRHNISFNTVYMLPFKGNRLKEGWQLSGVTSWHTGVNYSLGEGDQADLGNTFDSERPNFLPNAPGCNNNVYSSQNVNHWFNLNCFAPSTYGSVGNLGRNNLIGPGHAETDICVTKNTRITERVNLQFRAEIFNIFNHPNFSVPGGSGAGPTIINPGTNCGPTSTPTNQPSLLRPRRRLDHVAGRKRRPSRCGPANAVQCEVVVLRLLRYGPRHPRGPAPSSINADAACCLLGRVRASRSSRRCCGKSG